MLAKTPISSGRLDSDPRFHAAMHPARVTFVDTPIDAPVEISPLAPCEVARLKECERTIKRGLDTFFEVGGALNAIFELKLYRDKFTTFKEYCRVKWVFTSRRALQLRTAAGVVATLQANNCSTLPKTESQARELGKLPEADQVKVWKDMLKATNGVPTAKAIREVAADQWLKAKSPSSGTPSKDGEDGWPKPNKFGVYSDIGSDKLEYSTHQMEAVIRVLQVAPTQWIASLNYSFKVGSCSGRGWGLRRDLVFGSKTLAIERSLKDLQEIAQALASCQSSVVTKPERTAAHLLVKWCKQRLEYSSNAEQVEEKEAAATGFEMETKGTKTFESGGFKFTEVTAEEKKGTKIGAAKSFGLGPDASDPVIRSTLDSPQERMEHWSHEILSAISGLRTFVPMRKTNILDVLDSLEKRASYLHRLIGGSKASSGIL